MRKPIVAVLPTIFAFCVGCGSDPSQCSLAGGIAARTPQLCLGQCVDLDQDPLHCGSCDRACANGYTCRGGRCRERVLVPNDRKSKVDVLFMVDDSNSMDAMDNELRQKFDQFVKGFQDLADKGTIADLHVGVVTSDYGAGATGAPGCTPSGGGRSGKLQAIGQAASSSCKPPVGANYIAFDFANGGKNHNLPDGQDLVKTFTCMASVGSAGCGFEHQLESVYAALRNAPLENQGFLRDDALLTVIFVTNEDDSSAPPDTDMFDKNKSAIYGYESSYRQTRWGIMCDYGGQKNQLPPYGASQDRIDPCYPATIPPGKEYDVYRYIHLFTRPKAEGGVKDHPEDVILVAIDAPETPVQILLSNPGTVGSSPYVSCPQLNESSNPPCVPVLQHSCQNISQPVFFGDPAVRLNVVVRAVGNHAISSICDSDFSGALLSSAKRVGAAMAALGCVSGKFPNPTMPDCLVEDVMSDGNGGEVSTALKRCDQAGAGEACWNIGAQSLCQGLSADGVGLTVDRKGMKITSGATRALCVTTPS